MSSVMSKSEINILETYLEDVYENECELKALVEEVLFIQLYIEKFVQRIVEVASEEIARRYVERLQGKGETTDASQRQHASVDISHLEVIKVGSFYEKTKNAFPDEFDFIFYLCESQLADLNDLKYASHLIVDTARHLKETLQYSEGCYALGGTRRLYFDQDLGKHGPAAFLRFIYKNSCSKPRFIHVDIVPAVKTSKLSSDISWYYKFVEENMIPKSFREQVLSCGYFLKVNGRLSFTEAEVHFMKNILLRKHLKLYRILKYLLNGHFEKLEIFLDAGKRYFSIKGYCSYHIKTMVIYHHDERTNQQSDDIGLCALQVLKEMCKYGDSGKRLTFLGLEDVKETALLPYLKSLTQSLEEMKTFPGKYDYKSIKLSTVPSQYLSAVDKTDPSSDRWLNYLDYLSGEEPSCESWQEFMNLLK